MVIPMIFKTRWLSVAEYGVPKIPVAVFSAFNCQKVSQKLDFYSKHFYQLSI